MQPDERPEPPNSPRGGAAGRPVVDLPPGLPVRERSGCGKGLLIGCGGVLALLGVLSIVFMLKAPRLLDWVMTQTEEQLLVSFPADGTEFDRQRMTRAFEAARNAMSSRDVDPIGLPPLQKEIGGISQRLPDRVRLQDIRSLTLALEGFAGIDPPPEAPSDDD